MAGSFSENKSDSTSVCECKIYSWFNGKHSVTLTGPHVHILIEHITAIWWSACSANNGANTDPVRLIAFRFDDGHTWLQDNYLQTSSATGEVNPLLSSTSVQFGLELELDEVKIVQWVDFDLGLTVKMKDCKAGWMYDNNWLHDCHKVAQHCHLLALKSCCAFEII